MHTSLHPVEGIRATNANPPYLLSSQLASLVAHKNTVHFLQLPASPVFGNLSGFVPRLPSQFSVFCFYFLSGTAALLISFILCRSSLFWSYVGYLFCPKYGHLTLGIYVLKRIHSIYLFSRSFYRFIYHFCDNKKCNSLFNPINTIIIPRVLSVVWLNCHS